MYSDARRYNERVLGFELPTVRVTAANTAVGRGIHDDATAARYGYRGGLVPGATVYSYVNRVLADYFGSAWLCSGQMSIHFARPFYHGDVVTSGAVVTRRVEDQAEFGVWAENAEGTRCARGTATFPLVDSEEPPSSLPYIIDASESQTSPPLTPGNVPIGIPFRPVDIQVDPQANLAYAEQAGDSSSLYQRFIHPGILLGRTITRDQRRNWN